MKNIPIFFIIFVLILFFQNENNLYFLDISNKKDTSLTEGFFYDMNMEDFTQNYKLLYKKTPFIEPQAIVLHRTGGNNYKSTLNYYFELEKKGSDMAGHYLIDTTGKIFLTAPTNKYLSHSGSFKLKDFSKFGKIRIKRKKLEDKKELAEYYRGQIKSLYYPNKTNFITYELLEFYMLLGDSLLFETLHNFNKNTENNDFYYLLPIWLPNKDSVRNFYGEYLREKELYRYVGSYNVASIGIEIVGAPIKIKRPYQENIKKLILDKKISENFGEQLLSVSEHELQKIINPCGGYIYTDINDKQKISLMKLVEKLAEKYNFSANAYTIVAHYEIDNKTMGEGINAKEFVLKKK